MKILLTALIAVSCAFAEPVAAQVAGVRSFDGPCANDQPVDVRLDLDVAAHVPAGVIIVEKLPAGWVLDSATPSPSSFNAATGEARWVFFGNSMNDDNLDIQYTAHGSNTTTATFSGNLRQNDSEGEPHAVAIAGETTCTGAPRCQGDCNADGSVSIDEIVQMVNAALGNGSPECVVGNGGVTVDAIVSAVSNALGGCP